MTDARFKKTEIEDESIDIVITDPPYGVRKNEGDKMEGTFMEKLISNLKDFIVIFSLVYITIKIITFIGG